MDTSVQIAQKDKRWFITGASSGFGRLMTEYLLSAGARVVATARKLESIEELNNLYPGNVTLLQLDVTDQRSIDKAVADGSNALHRESGAFGDLSRTLVPRPQLRHGA